MDSFHLSFEFFPPKTEEGLNNLIDRANKLALHHPELMTVTYGAGGSIQSKTIETAQLIQNETGIKAAAHISCVGSTFNEINQLLNKIKANGIQHIVALRGDMPSGMGNVSSDFNYASDLVKYIKTHYPDDFSITVAAYPEYHPVATSPSDDLKHLAHKVGLGADRVFTQYFFNESAYFNLVDHAHIAGVDVPIIPGIMPITNYKQLARFSDMCKAEIPRWIREKLMEYDQKDDMTSLQDFGHDVVLDLCHSLIEGGAPGLHFYTLNKFEPSDRLVHELFDATLLISHKTSPTYAHLA